MIVPLPAAEPWDLPKLQSVLEEWPDQIPLVIVSYDHHDERKPVVEQIADARKFFRSYPQHLHLLLLKPEKGTQSLIDEALKSAFADATQLGSFDLVGVTERNWAFDA